MRNFCRIDTDSGMGYVTKHLQEIWKLLLQTRLMKYLVKPEENLKKS